MVTTSNALPRPTVANPPPRHHPAVTMPPKKTPKSKTVFFDVRAKPSGNFRVEFSDAGRDFRLGTYLTAHDAATLRRAEEEEDEADPSTVIPVESGSSDWGDLEEDDKGCDDPDKDKFWEQFKSSDKEFNLLVVVV
ncbi:uncharacterized protein [Aegilops tauschii subsp. strangulata]|uniref:uncharacterized protein n=1 Tax=Aegilops tauschii subsp. strangulata TaxID=200361 RepID=UPI003CC88A8F